MERKQFTFYRSFFEGMERFPESEWLGYLLAVIRFGLDGIEPDALTPVQSGMFHFVRPILESGRKKALVGSLGGRPSEKSKKKDKDKVKDKLKTQNNCEEGFREFWERYPVKLGREEAKAQWVRVCEKIESKDILLGLDRWLRSKSWQAENGRYVPKPEKWLRERWWEQHPEGAVPKGASGTLGKAELEAIERMFETE